MRRTFVKQDKRPIVLLHDITEEDEKAVHAALDVLRGSSNQPVKSMADLLSSDFAGGRIGWRAIERLSRWCNADGSYAASVEPAQKVARILLGVVPPRLIGEDHKRPTDYDARVDQLARHFHDQ